MQTEDIVARRLARDQDILNTNVPRGFLACKPPLLSGVTSWHKCNCQRCSHLLGPDDTIGVYVQEGTYDSKGTVQWNPPTRSYKYSLNRRHGYVVEVDDVTAMTYAPSEYLCFWVEHQQGAFMRFIGLDLTSDDYPH